MSARSTFDITERCRLELVLGDIVRQPDLDAVVNAANARLMPGGGVAGAIHAAAGPGLARECAPLAPVAPGEAVVTSGHDLPNPWVIHCLGPIYGHDEPASELLADCYRHALQRAEEKQMCSVGFPAISTGAFGYPSHEAASVALITIRGAARTLKHVRLVRFVLFDEPAFEAHRSEALKLFSHSGGHIRATST